MDDKTYLTYSLVSLKNNGAIKQQVISVTSVAAAAPFIPNIGIPMELRIKLTTTPQTTICLVYFCLFSLIIHMARVYERDEKTVDQIISNNGPLACA